MYEKNIIEFSQSKWQFNTDYLIYDMGWWAPPPMKITTKQITPISNKRKYSLRPLYTNSTHSWADTTSLPLKVSFIYIENFNSFSHATCSFLPVPKLYKKYILSPSRRVTFSINYFEENKLWQAKYEMHRTRNHFISYLYIVMKNSTKKF